MQKTDSITADGSRCRMQNYPEGGGNPVSGASDGVAIAPDRIYETSWEVCNKIGGIYTVLSTKARVLQTLHKDATIFIGPDVWTAENPSPVFKEYKTLLRNAASGLKLPYGISIRVGRWQVPGQPLAVLVNFAGIYEHLPEIYGRMWERFGVDSLHAYGDYGEGCAFAVASAIVIKALTEHLGDNPEHTVAHFDEWTTGMGLLYLEDAAPRIATLFTTHATSIGRSICGNGKPLYDYFSGYNGDQMARELNMESKHSLEKQAAAHADCFTTVSRVTEAECVQLLGVKPQVVTPNGFEPDFVPSSARYKTLRAKGRARLLALASALTGKTFASDTLLAATSGRNEYRNKGIDLFIDSMQRYAHDMADSERQALALILVPAWVKEPQAGLRDRMDGRMSGQTEVNFLSHRLNNEDSDAIACRLRSLNVNGTHDKVTYVYIPCYLDGKDGVLDISYYDLLPALDLTVFPSYYEPWGYTPLESIAFGVPTVSTDKAGFGQWILDETPATFAEDGAEVVERNDHNYLAAADSIARKTAFIASLSAKAAAEVGNAAARTASMADWSLFIRHYLDAFAVALRRRDARLQNK